jgi:hypothetical protein
VSQDSACIDHVRSVLEAARSEYAEGLISAPGLPFHPAQTYAETHFALAALILSFFEADRARWLDLAEARLRLWNDHEGPATFFNAMAVCLMVIVLKRARVTHAGLESILAAIVARTREHRQIAYGLWSGNNCYLQQTAVDLVLLPLARGETPTAAALASVATEFRRYRTPEGFFYDLPREGTRQERLSPPTYVLKMLFLLGICHEFHPTEELGDLFEKGMAAVLPLLARDGSFGYFGRTDNSPFSAGLAIFNLRMAARVGTALRETFWAAAREADVYYRSFPRTAAGLLKCNRFGDAASPAELVYSRDAYAKVGEYSVASCAYALLGYHCFPAPDVPHTPPRAPHVGQSRDLGLVKLTGPGHELILRTTSEATSWDRRYLGPTVLRFEVADELLVGAIPKTVSSDLERVDGQSRMRLQAMVKSLIGWYVDGFEQLDGTSVGFVPVVRDGGVDYLPYEIATIVVSPSHVEINYRMLKLHARGFGACAVELWERLRKTIPGSTPGERGPPMMRLSSSIECQRAVHVGDGECRIRDRLAGRLRGTKVFFSTRALPRASVRVAGLEKARTLMGWGSNGRQELVVYSARPSGTVLEYECVIAAAK